MPDRFKAATDRASRGRRRWAIGLALAVIAGGLGLSRTIVPSAARPIEPDRPSGPLHDTGFSLALPALVLGVDRSDLAPPRSVKPRPSPSASASPEPGQATATPSAALSYWRDAMPILRQECSGCHYDGGIAPFALEQLPEVRAHAPAIRKAMLERSMPPLPADPERGKPFDDPRRMTEADRRTLVDWIDAGAPEGDPSDAAPVPTPDPAPWGSPSWSRDIGFDFSPPADAIDEYRCFVIDPGFAVDTELRMVDIVPTASAMYHHGILYLIEPGDLARMRQLDAADPDPGYRCFGGPGVGAGTWVASEAVGSPARPYPDGTAMVIPAGSQFVLQLHYNTLNGVFSDRSRIDVWEAKMPVNRPPVDHRLANVTFRIPAGAKAYTATAGLDFGAGGGLFRPKAAPGRLWRVWGHMHMLGSRLALDLHHADGSVERLLDIPRWDFHWQGAYDLLEPVTIVAGDRIELTCVWDNSAENQPWVGGERQPPRRVGWGDGSLDEMCLGGITLSDD